MIVEHTDLSITTDGRLAEDFIRDLKLQGVYLTNYDEYMLRDPLNRWTTGVTYRLKVIDGDWIPDELRTIQHIREVASQHSLIAPPTEVAPYLREKLQVIFSAAKISTLVVAHDALENPDKHPSLFCLLDNEYHRKTRREFRHYPQRANSIWSLHWHCGFVFVESVTGLSETSYVNQALIERERPRMEVITRPGR